MEAIQQIGAGIVAVSGDLTQQARRSEFAGAVEFLKRLPGRHIVVPGDHDMAFLNPWRRMRQNLKLFHEMVSADSVPFYCDEEIHVLGLNTARVTHLRNGRIRARQVRHAEEKMAGAGPDAVRILVTHHPFDLPGIYPDKDLVGSGREFLPRLLGCIDVLLAGHHNISHAGPTAIRYQIEGQSAIFVQAGTALSTCGRGEANAFQVLRTSANRLETTQYLFDGAAFRPQEPLLFARSNGAWQPEPRGVPLKPGAGTAEQ